MTTHGATAESVKRVLIVEDSRPDATLATLLLQEIGVPPGAILHAETLADAFQRLRAEPMDLILLDLHLRAENALDHIPRLIAECPRAAIVVLTGSAEESVAEEALARGAQDYLHKQDLTTANLRRAVRYALNRQRHQLEDRQNLVAKKIVRRLLHDITRGVSTATLRRDLGKSLAAEVPATGFPDHFAQFSGMGAGELRLTKESPGRFEFSARGTIEATTGTSSPTCYITLGFLEATVAKLEGRPTLGTETHCQSQGHPECEFVVKTKE